EIIEGHMLESRHRRIESLFDFLLTGRRNSRERAAMKRIRRGNDFESLRVLPDLAREFEQTFVRFRAAVAKENATRRDKIDNAFRQTSLRFCIIEVRNVNEFPRLLVQCIGNFS